jgi:hypothetical protein
LASEGRSLRESANWDDGGTQVSGSYGVTGTTMVLLEEVR